MSAIFQPVLNRGTPPHSFITELIAWGRNAPDEIFAPNDNQEDIYALVKSTLGPWEGPLHRRAVMMECMRVHAGFESDWNWREGVDVTNKTSMTHKAGEEAGAWEMSFDMEELNHAAMRPFALAHGLDTPEHFIARVKDDHALDMECYARLVRVNIRWAGPLVSGKILPCLSRAAVKEFESALAA